MAGESHMESKEAVEALRRYMGSMDTATRHRGEHYYHTHRVEDLKRTSANALAATVVGSSPYRVELVFKEQTWKGTCTCPVAIDCKHCYAMTLEWRSELRGSSVLDDLRAKAFLFADAPNAGPKAKPNAPLDPDRSSFREKWETRLAKMLNRRLNAEEGTFLGRLSAFFNHVKTHRFQVYSKDLQLLQLTTQESRRSNPYQPIYEGWWGEPPPDPMALWQYVACDIERSGGKIPEFLKPVTDTAPIQSYLAGQAEREAVARWVHQFENFATVMPAVAAARGPNESGVRLVDFRVVLGSSDWRIDERLTPESSWRAVPRAFLDAFRSEKFSFIAVTGRTEILAAIAIVLDLYRQNYLRGPFERGGNSSLLVRRWLEHPMARAIAVGSNGGPVQFSPETLRWKLDPTKAGSGAGAETDFELMLAWPDGRLLDVDAVMLPGTPTWYLVEGPLVVAGPPPLDGKSPAGAILPAAALKTPAVLKTLRRHRTLFPRGLESQFVQVPTVVDVTCSLVSPLVGLDSLVLKLTVRSETPRTEQRWTRDGWEENEDVAALGPQPPPQSALAPTAAVVIPDLSLADEVAVQLPTLRMNYDNLAEGWVQRMTPQMAETFAAWREKLPPAVNVTASKELAALLVAPIRATVDFSLLQSDTHRDWFDLKLALRTEDSTLTSDEISLLLKAQGRFVNLPNKGWRRLQLDLDRDALAALEESGVDTSSVLEVALRGERQHLHALQLNGTKLGDYLPVAQVERLRARAKALALTETPKLPVGLRAELRTYQREGFEFLAFLASNGLGAVLADDMGLGKTVQTLAWLLWLQERLPAGSSLRVLVVCPKSVMGNWESECARFAPSIRVERSGSVGSKRTTPSTKKPARMHLRVMNYTQLRLQSELVRRERWDVVVLDEGQFIKNPASKVAQVARELVAEHRLVLTGTPIENRLLDLWSLFSFALPGLLGSQASFKRRFDQGDAAALVRLRRHVRHFMLRRTKAQVAADLPPRVEEDLVVEMEGEQARLYQAELKWARSQLLKVKTTAEFDRARFNILASLLKLRQICCHPALIDAAHADAPSAKLDALLEQLEELRDGGHQVLVFSQFVGMLEIVQARLDEAAIGYLILTGKTSNRDELVAQFQSDRTRTVFLLSLKAAGFGLNLTAASYVILYDPWWNPAVEAQAIDRTHRIGQVSPVNAYRLIVKDSIEQKIRLLQKEKSALSDSIVQEESVGALMDLDTIRGILSE